MAGELESCKSLSGLLSGLAQNTFHGHSGITEELLHSQLYPEVPLEEFRPFLAKMRGILKESEFLCLEFDEAKVKQILKKLSEVEESISGLMQAA
ncbi:COMM domain-containing protein 1 isoform X3 [Rattus norvegicus]|uniref:COMM domain-containing protein 1 isoform X3 n=1 Tax=Rattus norvegicus TaxID=10116 RepID=UPI0019172CA8|nr:COMM domain-containing protein 1 isoform X2 [Rattus norvegicus]